MESMHLAASPPFDDPLRQMALQLDDAQAALLQARRHQSEFLWALGHELRSPLTAILGFAQLMDAGTPAPTSRQKSSLAQILGAGWSLLAFIDEILDPSMIECGKLPLRMESVALDDVLRECELLVEPLARHSDVQVEFARSAQPLTVAADPARLRRILMTLLNHAVLHSGAAGSVRVSCHRSADGRLRVRFHDTSRGQSVAWLAHDGGANHIKLAASQHVAGYMGGIIATEFIAGTAGDASDYWLELNAVGTSP